MDCNQSSLLHMCFMFWGVLIYYNYLCIECICIINALIRVRFADTIYISFINECVCTALMCTCALCKVQRARICVCCVHSWCIHYEKNAYITQMNLHVDTLNANLYSYSILHRFDITYDVCSIYMYIICNVYCVYRTSMSRSSDLSYIYNICVCGFRVNWGTP